jgi:hypothetical protein
MDTSIDFIQKTRNFDTDLDFYNDKEILRKL